MDGARFANAVASLGVSPADVTWRAGVDVLSFGGTKNGAQAGEAVVFFDRTRADNFRRRCKQSGQLASKMRFLSAQWVGLLENDVWLRHARHANDTAAYLERRLAEPAGRAGRVSPAGQRGVRAAAEACGGRRGRARVAILQRRGAGWRGEVDVLVGFDARRRGRFCRRFGCRLGHERLLIRKPAHIVPLV